MTRGELIELFTVGAAADLARGVEQLLADPGKQDAGIIELCRRRLTRIGFELDDPALLEALAPLRERFFATFGR